MNTRYVSIGLISMVTLLFVMACNQVYDNLSGCLGNKIVFSYLADDNREHLQEHLDSMDVFIFGAESGNLVEKYHLKKEQFLLPLEVVLPEGAYRVVALGNAGTGTSVEENGTYDSAWVSRPELMQRDTQAAGSFDRLYLGEATIVSQIRSEASEDVVRLYSQHVKVHVELFPFDDTESSFQYLEGYRLTMGDLSARFSFSGVRSGSTSFDLPFVPVEDKSHFALDFNTLRFEDTDPIRIYLMKNQKVEYAVDLPQFIAEHSDKLRITGKQEAVLSLVFRIVRSEGDNVRVTVEPWEAVDVFPWGGHLGNRLVFSYLADDNREHLKDYLESIDAYIFDAGNGNLVKKYHLNKQQLLLPLDVMLPEGAYKVVAVGNAGSNTSIAENGRYDSAWVSRPELINQDMQARATFDKLYLGETTILSQFRNETADDVVRLYSQHVKIHAEIQASKEDTGRYYLRMEPLAARFSFGGKRSGETSFQFPFVKKGEGSFALEFYTLRFEDTDAIKMYLIKNGVVLYSIDVAHFIAQWGSRISITGKQEAVFSIVFRTEGKGDKVRINVEPWDSRNVFPIVHK